MTRLTPLRLRSPATAVFAAVLVVLFLLPMASSTFFINFVMARTMMLGLAAATIVFLAAYGGMISLAQLLFFGISGFMFGNAVLESGARGLNLGWPPWVAIVFALGVTTVVALLLGALASRTTGIYFLMLTLVYGVIGFYVFAQVVPISGPGGVTSIPRPAILGDPVRLYYGGLILSAIAYVGFRALSVTPFGRSLQGVRDDPIRMASLGFNVPLHRMLAFTLAGFIAGLAGLLNVWWNGQIDPASIGIGPTLTLLIIAVIGGMSRFEGAWVGAFVYLVANNYMRDLPLVGRVGITEARFNTIIGLLVLLIMVLSPEGLVGIFEKARGRWQRAWLKPSTESASTATTSTSVGGSGPPASNHDTDVHTAAGGDTAAPDRPREGTDR
jgi:branched-chain amino acid transport system permease protein